MHCATVTHMGQEEVSVRELRQNLSFHLRRVREGQTLAVTSRGERVAVLAPISGGSRLDRLVAEGRISSPEAPWVDPEPAPAHSDGSPRRLTDALLEQRAGERS
jgi:prevent-host-death family protein